jgi:prephenate dehydrogenase
MRVGIVGLGLIGGSLGLALRRLGGSIDVHGIAHDATGARAAEQRGAVVRASTDLEDLTNCDVVVVATPINQMSAVLDRLSELLPPQTLITDVASVKRPVLAWACRLREPARFLGGHPVAGKERSGLRHSDERLFDGEPWIFTPQDGQALNRFDEWIRLVKGIGARPHVMSAEAHDRQMAFLSHLAFTISTAYAHTVRQWADPDLGGPGFRGMVRLADGDPTLYQEIAAANRGALLEAIDRFSEILDDVRDGIDRGDHLAELFGGGVRAAR